jgi:hypothetical protein
VQSFYQRILASDPDEVAFQAEILLKETTLLDYYQDVALPALALAQVDVARGVLDRDRQIEVCASVEHVVEDLAEHEDFKGETESEATDQMPRLPDSPSSEAMTHDVRSVLCLGGRTPLDQAACAILVQLLSRDNVSTRIAGPDALSTTGVSGIGGEGVDAACIFYLDRQNVAPIRFAVRRLRKKFPKIPIAVCLWGASELAAKGEAARADATLGTLQEAVEFCQSPPSPPKPAATAAGAPLMRLVSG